jgi:hypothetical protein
LRRPRARLAREQQLAALIQFTTTALARPAAQHAEIRTRAATTDGATSTSLCC